MNDSESEQEQPRNSKKPKASKKADRKHISTSKTTSKKRKKEKVNNVCQPDMFFHSSLILFDNRTRTPPPTQGLKSLE